MSDQKKPNIVMIMADDVGTWNVSAYHRGMMGHVFQFDDDRVSRHCDDEKAGYSGDLGAAAQRLGLRSGQRFLIGPDGFPDLHINGFLGSPRMPNLAETTNRDYAHSLALWLNFLSTRGCRWQDATVDDAEKFQFWRLTDPANRAVVVPSTFAKDVAACKKFYSWAAAGYRDISDVSVDVDFPRAKRLPLSKTQATESSPA
jgi:hypothetical protein